MDSRIYLLVYRKECPKCLENLRVVQCRQTQPTGTQIHEKRMERDGDRMCESGYEKNAGEGIEERGGGRCIVAENCSEFGRYD